LQRQARLEAASMAIVSPTLSGHSVALSAREPFCFGARTRVPVIGHGAAKLAIIVGPRHVLVSILGTSDMGNAVSRRQSIGDVVGCSESWSFNGATDACVIGQHPLARPRLPSHGPSFQGAVGLWRAGVKHGQGTSKLNFLEELSDETVRRWLARWGRTSSASQAIHPPHCHQPDRGGLGIWPPKCHLTPMHAGSRASEAIHCEPCCLSSKASAPGPAFGSLGWNLSPAVKSRLIE
jgi:hypothetical protein